MRSGSAQANPAQIDVCIELFSRSQTCIFVGPNARWPVASSVLWPSSQCSLSDMLGVSSIFSSCSYTYCCQIHTLPLRWSAVENGDLKRDKELVESCDVNPNPHLTSVPGVVFIHEISRRRALQYTCFSVICERSR